MAVIGGRLITELDIIRNSGARERAFVNTLALTNPILQDQIFMPCNGGDSHKEFVLTGLPKVSYFHEGEGIAASKGAFSAMTDITSKVGGRCKLPEDMLKLAAALVDPSNKEGKVQAMSDARSRQAKLFFEAIGQADASTLFYGNNRTDRKKFTGLITRYNDPYAENAENIVSGSPESGHDGNLTGNKFTSLLLVGWHEDWNFGIYPTGVTPFIERDDLGRTTQSTEAIGDRGQAEAKETEYWTEKFTLRRGIMNKDWRQVARGCNIDITKFGDGNPETTTDLINLAINMFYRIYTFEGGKFAWYCNKQLAQAFHFLAKDQANETLTLETVEGRPVTMLLGIPVRPCDSILSTEAPVPDSLQNGEADKGNKVKRFTRRRPFVYTRALP